ncbi:MAG: hypothetical protein ACP5QG_04800 [candidate division WOR-3 bacterium]
MIHPFYLRTFFGLLAGMVQAPDGSGLGLGVEGGLLANTQRARFSIFASYSKLSSETTFDTTASISGGGYVPGQIPATRSLDALNFTLGPSVILGRSEISLWLGTSFHTSERVTDDAGYTLDEYPSKWVFLGGGGLGWNWEKLGLCLFVDRHMGDGGLWILGGRARFFP